VRLGTNSTAIVVGANLSLLWLVLLTGHLSPDHRRLPDGAPVPARLHGHTCYRLTFPNANWDPIPTPHEVELVDSLWPFSRQWRKAYLRDPERPGLSFWFMAGADSIDMVLATEGVIGVIARVATGGDTLTGRAWAAYDTPVDSWAPPDATVQAAPIPCAELRPTARRALSARP
jgi:hypothetical protein